MNRRTFLGAAAAGTLGGLAGCSGINNSGATTATSRNKSNLSSRSVAGVELPVPQGQLRRGAPKDAIPAITDPVFAEDWSDVDANPLAADDTVLGVSIEGEARAYPLRIMNWHEIVNDTMGGPLLVSYCPLCGSAIAADRTVGGEETIFGVSGLLWKRDLVMYDQLSNSLWSQIAATAIRGERTGDRLNLVPASLTSWAGWQDDHPDTEVLLPPPESNTVTGQSSTRDYNRNPYAGYDRDKREVLGINVEGEQKAYPLPVVREEGVVNDTVGGLPVVVAVAADDATMVAYDRRVDGTARTFERASADHLSAADSRWKITTGEAIDGPHAGTTLEPATNEPQMFEFAWRGFHPDTAVYSGD